VFERFTQDVRPYALVAGGNPKDNARPASPFADEPAFLLKVGVRARDRIRRHVQIVRKLPHCRKRRSLLQVAALNRCADLLFDLLIRRYRDLRINRNGNAH
jgi:hypothetical protein